MVIIIIITCRRELIDHSDTSNCMHTAAGEKEAWLHLDLGDIYNLKSVKIWYRNDSKLD